MKETVLITGAGPNGVTGRLIKSRLQDDYNILSPSSKELDLTDANKVNEFFHSNKIDYIIHCALYRATNDSKISHNNDEMERNLRMFYALASKASLVKKMIYFGSGAEYDKSHAIVNVSEEADYGKYIPYNVYGFSKYIMNKYAVKSDNIYNFRLFGTINPFEKYTKNVISNICIKCIKSNSIELMQDCKFSWIDIDDVIAFIRYAFNNDLKYHDYNLVHSQQCTISDIARMIIDINNTNKQINFRKEGLNLEYTASNVRWLNEFDYQLTPIKDSIYKVYHHMVEISDTIELDKIDLRWS